MQSNNNYYDISRSRRNDEYCIQCKGSCLRKSSSATQAAALERFGIIPNNCVAPEVGKPLCPYR